MTGMAGTRTRVVVAGATGFVGSALVPALLARGHEVRACARHFDHTAPSTAGLEHMHCDLLDPTKLPSVLSGSRAAFYLVHSMGGRGAFREKDRRAASGFAAAAAEAGLERVIYLGGVAPRGRPSEHLASRLEVGNILRAGAVPTIELRAAMIIGAGGASWQIVRDLSLRLPAMILPAWLDSRMCPIALGDVVHALVDALDVPVSGSAVYDIAGRDTLTGREILERITALEGRRLPVMPLPWLTPRISAVWLRLVTRTDYVLARELVLGLTEDLLPESRRYWELTGYEPALSFDAAARAALEEERRGTATGLLAAIEEMLVRRLGPRARASP